MLRPICVKCHRFFRPKKTGFYFTEGMQRPGTSKPAPGTAEPENWQPYKLWVGDLWECRGCGAEIISGTGNSPIGERHQSGFDKVRSDLNAWFQVNDC